MRVPRADMFVCPMRTQSDTAAVEQLLASGEADAETVVALVGKSEGTGLHNDSGRVLADLSLRRALAARLGTEPEAVAERVPIVLSGGCPGVISPHVTVVTQEWVEVDDSAAPAARALVVGRAHSGAIAPEDVGRMGQITKVAEAVRSALADAGVSDPHDVHAVMVKAPSLSVAAIRDAESRGRTVVTRDLSIGESGAMCFSNDASALGVALALGEVQAEALGDDAVRRDWSLYSEVALTSSGGEKHEAEVLLLANRAPSLSRLRAGHGILRDIVDAEGVKDALRSAGLEFDCCPSQADRARIVQVFAKLSIPGSDIIRGQRITLLDDHDGYHVAKAIGGTLVASVTGRTAVFVSGGERNSHMGPPNGNPVAAVVRLPEVSMDS